MADLRLTLSRSDLAPADREGLDRATDYRPTKRFRVTAPVTSVRREPHPIAEQIDQLLHGEVFHVLRVSSGFAWGQSARSGYVGWAAQTDLSAELEEATHRVVALRTIALSEARVRANQITALSLNALVRVEAVDGAFSRIAGLGWAPSAHLAPIGRNYRDVVETAKMFLGAPYAWGGKDSLGLDCSGLVQQAFWASGRACPRDADQQAALGVATEREALAGGDLVCWPGHIGLMVDTERLIHANAHHMAVAIEPVAEAIDRIAASVGPPTAFRRVANAYRANT